MAETLEISEVYRAAQVLRDVARHPRLIGVPKINPEAEVYLKPETSSTRERSNSVAHTIKYHSLLPRRKPTA